LDARCQLSAHLSSLYNLAFFFFSLLLAKLSLAAVLLSFVRLLP
jgi:hypothetical protein